MRFASTRSKEDMLISKIVENSKNKTKESKQFYKTLIGSGFHTADRQTDNQKTAAATKTANQRTEDCTLRYFTYVASGH